MAAQSGDWSVVYSAVEKAYFLAVERVDEMGPQRAEKLVDQRAIV